MIQLIESPEQYSSAYSPVVFKFNKTGVEHEDIQILKGTEIVGIKQYRNEGEILVNVAEYGRSQIDVLPAKFNSLSPAIVSGRAAAISVAGNVINMSAGVGLMAQGVALSNALYKRSSEFSTDLCPGEFDEISCCGTVSVKIYALTPQGLQTLVNSAQITGMVALVVDYDAIVAAAPNAMSVYVDITANGKALPRITYRLRQFRSGVRLAWWNRAGGIDYYTFRSDVSKSVNVQKTKVNTYDGWITTSSIVSASNNITTGLLPYEQLEWLGELLSSSRVWIAEDRVLNPVDVTTTEMTTHQINGMSQLSLSIRPVKSLNVQRI